MRFKKGEMNGKVSHTIYLLVCGSVCGYFIYFTTLNFEISNIPSIKETVSGTFESVLKFISNSTSEIQAGEPDSCRQLLKSDGHLKCFLDHHKSKTKICPIEKKFWQPMGCDVHNYNTTEVKECMKNISSKSVKKKIIMLGDSRIRHLYFTLKSKLQNKAVHDFNNKIQLERYDDKETGLTLTFYTRLLIDELTIEHLLDIIIIKPRPFLLFIGNALHSIRNSNGTLEGLRSYRRNFEEMVPLLEILAKNTTVIWMLQSPLVAALEGMSDPMIELYNNVAVELLRGTHVHIMYSARSIGIATLSNYLDNTHLGIMADKMIVEIILNFICNKHVTIQEKFVCCRQ